MRVLVFGASGQVAQSLQTADAPNHDVVAFGRPDGDLTNAENLARVIDIQSPDVVINAAAYTAVDKAETDQDAAFAVNRDGPGHLAKLCKSAGVPLIHYSTDYVYDGRKSAPYVETDPTGPMGVYGQSKLAGEEAIREHWDKHVILRTAWVFSPFGNNFLKTMVRLGGERDELNVVSDQVGTPTFAPDIAVATLRIAEQLTGGSAHFGTYHLANSGETSWFGFASEIFEHATSTHGISCKVSPIPTEAYPTPAERPKNSRLNTSLLKNTFGIELVSWQQRVTTCLNQMANR